ncbi:MAG: hypothetical protein HOP28_05910 [Gemmatimonadales bacterium]|nr:hypothetical protein [Gemmatimonadales bacterium]
MSRCSGIRRAALATLSLVAGIGVTTGAAQAAAPLPNRPSVADWRADFEQMISDILVLHPEPFTKTGKHTFQRDVEILREAIPTLTDEQRLARMMKLVGSLGDGHTVLEANSPAYAIWYPVRVIEFADGYFIVTAHESVADLAGAQVLEIAGRPVAEVAAEARAVVGADNPSALVERLWALHNASIMKGLGRANPDGGLSVRLKLSGGRVVERTLPAMRANHPRYQADGATFEWRFRPEVYGTPIGTDSQWVTSFRGLRATAFQTADTTRPVHLTDRRPYNSRALPAQQAYYVRMNYITDTDFIPFVQKFLGEVDLLKPKHLILDWRQNFGGDGSKVQYMTREFLKRADAPPWGAIYILTGSKTFSAAIGAIDALVDHLEVTIVGEPSAAGFNHYGDPTYRTYPRTGLRLSVSTLWHQLSNSRDLAEFVPVDVPAPWSFADFAAGKDPAVDPILRGIDMRSIPVIATSDGGTAAAAAYRDRAARFGGLWWWGPPSEFALRQSCDLLRERGRLADAVAACRLNADLHPHTWNVWYNLGFAQRAAGMLKERLASYRCVIAIAPENWNVPTLQRLLAQPGNEGSEMAPGCPAGR